jgi:hypothetical protein
MTRTEAEQQSNQEQIVTIKNRFYAASNTLLDQFEETGDLKKLMSAASAARIHRNNLRDELKFTSIPVAPKKSSTKKSSR